MKLLAQWAVSDFEDAIIAAMVIGGAALCRELISRGISMECFDGKHHRITFGAIEALLREGSDVNELGLVSQLTFSTHSEYQSFWKWMFDAQNRIDHSTSGIEAWVGRFLEQYKLRMQKDAMQRAAIISVDDPEESRRFVEEQFENLDSIGHTGESDNELAISELLNKTDKQIQGNEPLYHLEMPFPGWGDQLSNFERNEFILIGARPSVGKSSLGIQILGHNLRKGKRFVHITAETTAASVISQMAAQVTKVNRRLIHTELHEKINAYKDAIEKIGVLMSSGKLLILEQDDVGKIEASIDRMASIHGPIDGIFVDYIQLMRLPGEKSRFQELSSISRTMKKWTMPKSFDCPVFGMCQISRDVEKGERPPRNSDLKESGSFEQDGNRVIFIHRPEEYEGQKQFSRDIQHYQILQTKCRDGPVGIYECEFTKQWTLFRGLDQI